MLYPTDVELKLGFDKIRSILRNNCSSQIGRTVVDRMKFSSNYDHITKLLAQTKEYEKIIESGLPILIGDFIDIDEVLAKK